MLYRYAILHILYTYSIIHKIYIYLFYIYLNIPIKINLYLSYH